MTRQIITFLLFVWLLPAGLQATETNDPAVDFTLENGLKVIFLPTPNNEVVAVQLVMPGAALRQTEATAGVEELLLQVMIEGSLNHPKLTLNQELDRMGASLQSSVDKDYSLLKIRSIRPFAEPMLKILADVLAQPLLKEDEIELQRQQQLASIRAKQDDPDQLLSLVLNEQFYAGHPYKNDIDGTETSVTSFTREDLVKHHKDLIREQGHFLVIVGDLSINELRPLLDSLFGQTSRDLPSKAVAPRLTPSSEWLTIQDREQPTQYILGKFVTPAPGKPHYAALKIGLELLSQRLWDEVRTKRGLSYAVYSGLASNHGNFGYLYVTTPNENEALPAIYNEVQRLKTELIAPEDLKAAKAVYRTKFYMAIEANQSQAGFLSAAEVYLGGYQNRNAVIDAIREVTPEQVRDAARATMVDFSFAVVGKENEVERDVFSTFNQKP